MKAGKYNVAGFCAHFNGVAVLPDAIADTGTNESTANCMLQTPMQA